MTIDIYERKSKTNRPGITRSVMKNHTWSSETLRKRY